MFKLEACGCKGRALKLLRSYFKDRYLYVVAKGMVSALKPYYSGVPQGGIWSPKLWNFYIQDMVQCFQLSAVKLYADDCTAVMVFDPQQRLAAIADLNADLKRVARWGRRWKTTFEPTKTHAMLISNSRDQALHPSLDLLEFDRVKIGYETELKIVGVIYDEKLNWSKMAEEMASKGRRAMGFLKRLQCIISSFDLAVIYKYFVRSKMEFGCASYIGAADSHLGKLDEVQRRAEKLSGVSFQSLDSRRQAACFGLLCKLLDGACTRPLQEVCEVIQLEKQQRFHQYNTSHTQATCGRMQVTNMENKLRKVSLETFKRSFICKIHKIFAQLPDDIKESGMHNSWL